MLYCNCVYLEKVILCEGKLGFPLLEWRLKILSVMEIVLICRFDLLVSYFCKVMVVKPIRQRKLSTCKSSGRRTEGGAALGTRGGESLCLSVFE